MSKRVMRGYIYNRFQDGCPFCGESLLDDIVRATDRQKKIKYAKRNQHNNECTNCGTKWRSNFINCQSSVLKIIKLGDLTKMKDEIAMLIVTTVACKKLNSKAARKKREKKKETNTLGDN